MWRTAPSQNPLPYSPSASVTDDKLDRALVAGLILEVMLESPQGVVGRRPNPRLIKSRLRDYLVEHLAGKVTLDRFRTLASRLDQWFEFYYPLLTHEPCQSSTIYTVSEPAAAYVVQEPKAGWRSTMTPRPQISPTRPVFWEELLDRWLAALDCHLPQRSHRKISPRKLKDFLRQTAGGWFKLRDFERFFQVDRKTAWDYLQQFLQAGLICHNRRQSAAVRYCAAPQLLKVEADTLRLALSLAFPEASENLVERLGDLLVATAGEPFQEREWQAQFSPREADGFIQTLCAHNILTIQVVGSGVRLMRLRGRWLQARPVSGQLQ